MNYQHIQFISWEIYTGPYFTENKKGKYIGIHSVSDDKRIDVIGQCKDISARIEFTKDAIEKAYSKADQSSKVLKVFMAPEFLYRGAGGAYLHDLINGWESDAPQDFGSLPVPYSKKWGGLFGGLQQFVQDDQYEDWIFIFGTALSASFPTKKRLDDKYYLDPSKPGEIYNTALIQRGGTKYKSANYASRKHYISGMDFLNKNIESALAHINGKVKPFDPEEIIPSDLMGVTEGGALFQIKDTNDKDGKLIDFGIEICLDHARSGGNGNNKFGRIRTAGEKVTIQLVPSGGMALQEDSIFLKNNDSCYAFNCDGFNGLTEGYNSHSQIWNKNKSMVIEATGGENADKTSWVEVAKKVKINVNSEELEISSEDLWDSNINAKGSGNVRIIKPLPL